MRIGFRVLVVGLPSLLLAIACLGENQCLNPQPDLPACRGADGASSFGGKSSFAGAPGGNDAPSAGGTPGTSSGGGSINVGNGGSMSGEGVAGSRGDFGGAGGDSLTLDPNAEAGAGGAAGSDHGPL